jgi:prolyl oligopeptidase
MPLPPVSEVLMSGGLRLLAALSSLLLVAAVSAKNGPTDDAAPQPSSLAPPEAEQKPVIDMYHGTKVLDNYRWLENAQSPETQKWVASETAYTRSILDPLPGRNVIHKRLTELLEIGSITPPEIAGRYYFYTKREGRQNQPVLYVRENLREIAREEAEGHVGETPADTASAETPSQRPSADRVLVDVNQLSADGTISLDWFQPSYNGKYVAYGTSSAGSEMSTLHVIETKTGTMLPDTIERTRACSIAWLHDNSGFYYTRYPDKGDVPAGQEMYNRHVFFHLLGSPVVTDDKIFGEGRDPEDWPGVHLSNDGHWLLIDVEQGWTKSELFLMDLRHDLPPTRVTTGKNFLYRGEVFDGKLYITTNEDAPRYRVFVTDAGDYERDHWKELVPQSDAVLQGVAVYGRRLFALYEQNATSQLKMFDLDGKKLSDIALPAIGTVFATTGRWNREEAFFGFQSFTVPPSIYRIDLKSGPQGLKPASVGDASGTTESRALPNPDSGESTSGNLQPTLWAKVEAPSTDPSAYEVAQEWFHSKDGTRVTMFVVHKKGLAKNGHNPTLLTGYGGFNVSLTPTFSRTAYLWMEHGGIYAVANLRGGSEFGEDWHRAGMLDKKQNVFDDMIAAAEHLISEKYTDPRHLAIQGGSNGGLLMGAMITQRPDLFRAVICQVPLLDMIHYQEFQIAKLWIPEYGTAENPQQFKWLYAYSPYHHVKAGVEYPAILFMTADTDTRVDPMHAKKMTAEMQTLARNGQSRTRPILLRIETQAGHGAGKPVTKQIEEFTDVYSFLFWQVGVKEASGVAGR